MIKILQSALCLGLMLPSLALAAPTSPDKVLFYPGEARLSVEEELGAEDVPGIGRAFVLDLPRTADRASFSVSLDGKAAPGFYWLEDKSLPRPLKGDKPMSNSDPAREEDPARREILQNMADLRDKLDANDAVRKGAEARIALWSTSLNAEQACNVQGLSELDQALEARLPALYAEINACARIEENLQASLKEAQERLAEYDKNKKPQWLRVAVPLATPNSVGRLSYSYIVPASCASSYRLDASPDKGSLSITQNAALFQDSGFPWQQAEIFISTTRRDSSLSPAVPYAWRLALDSKAPSGALREAYTPKASMMQAAEIAVEDAVAAPAPPRQEELGSFRLWSLGRRDLAEGVPVNLALASDEYEAAFYYTLRPALNPKGYLSADLNLKQPLELPPGQADFYVDGVSVGRRSLSINGDKVTLYFGSDPQVSAQMKDIKLSSGEQGLISKEQSRLWHWHIEVRNTRGRTVDLRIEDPMPDAQDNAVKLSVESNPKPEEIISAPQQGSVKLYCWRMTLKPGESASIEHKVRALAPADRYFDPGRGY